jgi:hypothetical protein
VMMTLLVQFLSIRQAVLRVREPLIKFVLG